jgi:peroxiredoxin Q/BCP
MLARLLAVVLGLMLAEKAVADGEILNVGDEFPNWSLIDQTGSSVTSVGFTGRAPDCTAEGRGFRDHYRQFEAAGIAVLNVSFDGPQTNGTFAIAEGFPFSLLTDSSREFSFRVGALENTAQERPMPLTYLVGADGRIVKVYTTIQHVRHAQEVLFDAGVAAP